MEDPAKRRAHSMPSKYITLQQLQEQRLREKQKEMEEEEERQRQLEKQRVEEEEKERERRHLKSIQTQRIKAPGGPGKKNSSGEVKSLFIDGEITGREGEVEESKKSKKSRKKRKGKRTADVETVNDRASNGEITNGIAVSSAGITRKIAGMKVSDHEEMDGADGLDEKSTAEWRRISSRAKTVRRATAVKGEKTAEMNDSDGRNGSFRDEKRGSYVRKKGAGRRPEPAPQITAVESVKPDGLDGPDRADEGFLAENRGAARWRGRPERPLLQIGAANREATAKIDGADEADGKDGGRTEPARPPAVFVGGERGKMDGSDGADERSAVENKSTSPSRRLLFAVEKPGERDNLDGMYAGSTVKIRSFPGRGGRYTAGTRSGFGERRFGGRPGNGQGQVWVPKAEIPDAHRFGGPAAVGGDRDEAHTPKQGVKLRQRLLG